ncbi:MAG: SUMF1/EgtB/PvdO family nonheme iron enzyme, partial [Pseudomonadota bacterium]
VPFDGEADFVVKEQQVNAPPPDPRQRNSQLSPCLANVILKALAKSPEDRFQDCNEFLSSLLECLPGLDRMTAQIFPNLTEDHSGNSKRRHSGSQTHVKSRLIFTRLTQPIARILSHRPLFWGLTVFAAVAVAGWMIMKSVRHPPVSSAPPKPLTTSPEGTDLIKGATRRTIFRDKLLDGTAGPQMIVIPAGEFRMGDIQGSGAASERPVHTVRIRKSFAVGRSEITFNEYDVFVTDIERDKGRICRDERGKEVPIREPNDRGWGRGVRPVMGVSWNQAQCYVRWLSDQTGKKYRLPSEAKWEYAARGGTPSTYYWGDATEETGKHAWYVQNSGYQTHPVSQKQPNGFGLYDISGNVYEWMADCWHEDYTDAPADGSAWLETNGGECSRRVLRGGSWDSNPKRVRSAARDWNLVNDRFDDIGFRVVKEL